MRDLFVSRAGATAEVIRGSGGVFEITVDGAMAFSKKACGRFPDETELDALLAGTA